MQFFLPCTLSPVWRRQYAGTVHVHKTHGYGTFLLVRYQLYQCILCQAACPRPLAPDGALCLKRISGCSMCVVIQHKACATADSSKVLSQCGAISTYQMPYRVSCARNVGLSNVVQRDFNAAIVFGGMAKRNAQLFEQVLYCFSDKSPSHDVRVHRDACTPNACQRHVASNSAFVYGRVIRRGTCAESSSRHVHGSFCIASAHVDNLSGGVP